MKTLVQVVYVGAKPTKYDNVLNRRELTWSGYGSSQMVPEEDAAVYFRYPAVWAGETEFATLDKSRKTAVAKTVVKSRDADDKEPDDNKGKTEPPATGDDRDLLVQAAILKLNKSDRKDFTEQGRPRIDRVVEIVGTNVSAVEIDAAIKALKTVGKF